MSDIRESVKGVLAAIVPDLTKPQSGSVKLGNAFVQISSQEEATSELITLNPQIENPVDSTSLNDKDKKQNLGSAFKIKPTEETSSSQNPTNKPSRKPIIGSAFNDSENL